MQTANKIKIIAHRAGNSIDSLNKALSDGADIIELDVHMSKDHVLLVQHTPYLRINGSIIFFDDFIVSENISQNILTLASIIEIAREKKIKLLLDIKKGKKFYNNISSELVGIIEMNQMENYIDIISFDHKCIQDIRKANPSIRAGIMYVARLYSLSEYLFRCRPVFIEICDDYLDEEAIRVSKELGIEVYGWGTDNEDTLLYYKSIGMDAVTVDDVTSAVSLLKK